MDGSYGSAFGCASSVVDRGLTFMAMGTSLRIRNCYGEVGSTWQSKARVFFGQEIGSDLASPA